MSDTPVFNELYREQQPVLSLTFWDMARTSDHNAERSAGVSRVAMTGVCSMLGLDPKKVVRLEMDRDWMEVETAEIDGGVPVFTTTRRPISHK